MLNGSDNKAVNTILSTEEKGPGPSPLSDSSFDRAHKVAAFHGSNKARTQAYISLQRRKKSDLSEAIIASSDELVYSTCNTYVGHQNSATIIHFTDFQITQN